MSGLSVFDEYLIKAGVLTSEEKEKLKVVSLEFQKPAVLETEYGSTKCRLEFCILNGESEKIDTPIFYIPGLSSSYRAAESLVKVLAIKSSRTIVIITKPNAGRSDDLPPMLRKYETFEVYSELIYDLIKKIFTNWAAQGKLIKSHKVELVGSSLAAPIITKLGHDHPHVINSLILIHPVSITNEFSFTTGSRYIPQLFEQVILHSDADPAVAIVNKIIKDDSLANNTNARRLTWRLWEMHTVTNGLLPENLTNNSFPTLVIGGGDDKLVPPTQIQSISALNQSNIKILSLPGMCHYSPYWKVFEYSDHIIKFLKLSADRKYTIVAILKYAFSKLRTIFH